MITREAALKISSDNFPVGPEALARYLSVTVIESPLNGVEGWCIRGPNTVIRVNSNSVKNRRRFTLAHELAHLVLGTDPDIASEPFKSDKLEEREADRLASELLIPDAQLYKALGNTLPVDAKTLSRLAGSANVSPVMVACRVVNSTDALGLKNSAIVFFKNGQEAWRYSPTLRFSASEAKSLLDATVASKPDVARTSNPDGNIVVSSMINAPVYQVLLIQLLPEALASQETYDERLRNLSSKVFGGNKSFQQRVNGCLNAVKNKCEGQSLEQAYNCFLDRYINKKFKDAEAEALCSPSGQQYLRLFLQRWFN
ncbi:MAG: ImmA/IrrE family metallo-endopeptidase [Planctomycetaceae bacterium]|nr:ImmA/IrrE family metallo-endopeptidase [Planctomycetaceae bacterium]